MKEHDHEKKLKQAEIGAVCCGFLLLASLGLVTQKQYDPRNDMKAPGGAQFRIFSDPPEAKILLVNNQGEQDHELGLTNEQILTVQDFLTDGEEAAPNWSYKIRLEKQGCAPAELTVTEAEARTGFIPSSGKPLPELHIRSLPAFVGYLWNYRRGAGFFLFLGLVGLAGFGWKVLEGRRKRKVLLRYEADPNTDSYVGKILHGHLVTRVLGSGGFGKVYEVLDAVTLDEKKPKALKVVGYEAFAKKLEDDSNGEVAKAFQDARERFMREMETLVTSDHPSICKIFDYGREKLHDWVLMPKYDQSLSDLLRNRTSLTPKKILSIARQIAEGLEYAHERRITHRDLKPDNVMLTGEQVILIDFGIAKPKDKATITAFDAVMGTLKYLAPEQSIGNSETLVDQYAYGLIVFELLTGEFPYILPLGDLQILQQRLMDEPRKLREVAPHFSEELEKVLTRMTEREPLHRYPKIMEAYNALEQVYLKELTSSELAGP